MIEGLFFLIFGLAALYFTLWFFPAARRNG
jgi:hypothetical protein